MIRVSGISKWYGPVRALHNVSFEVPRAQIVGLLGPNGAGKTTTIRIATGFMPPSSGSASINGHDTVEHSIQARRCIGYLPDTAPLYPEMAVDAYLDYRGRLYGLPRRERRAAADRVIDRCALGSVRSRRVGQLSKGYRQRVGLAAAMLHSPPVLILDEPVSGLDPGQILEVRTLIRELAQDRTVLVSSHILSEVELTCDRVIIIAGGTVRADGTPEDLLEALRTDAPYIAEVNAGGLGAERLAAVLKAVPGITGVMASPMPESPGWVRCLLTPARAGSDLRESIAGALRSAPGGSLLVRELRRERPTLEQFFLTVTDDPHAAPATAGAAPEAAA
jgi:ABC-2 type transport system ATP-binding protein